MLLATGFGPFPGAPMNPTAWLMEDLGGFCPEGVRLVTHTLAVTYDLWERELAGLVDTHRPEGVVAFGLSARARGITLETVARNVLDPGQPDARGALPAGSRIVPGGPDVLERTLPLELTYPHALSDDAGSYICNLTLYRLLQHGQRAVFVHVPPMPEAELRAGARAVLEAAARYVREASSRRDDVPLLRSSAAT